MTALLWDLDGTLVDSAADIARAADTMLVAHGLPPLGTDRIRVFIGDGASRLVDRCVLAAGGTPDAAKLDTFLAAYHAIPVARTVVFPGILDLLRDVAVPQAVVTNKPERLTRLVLDALALMPFFPVVIGGDTLAVRKPDPAPLRAALHGLGRTEGVMIGDGPADVGAAAAAGIEMIGVDWGISQPVGAPVRCADVMSLREALSARRLLR